MGETGESSRHRQRKHVSVKDKSESVLRILKGEQLQSVADELGVSASRVERWRTTFLSGGAEALEKRSESHKGGAGLGESFKSMRIWALFIFVLLIVILALQRFLGHGGE